MSVAKIFDESFYLSNNADVVVAISQGNFASALQHYQLFGGKSELRDPNASFDASYYAAQNPDVLSAVSSGAIANVFTHYQTHGEAENRAPTAAFAGFDSAAYLAANADVQAAVTAGSFVSALDHYIAFGRSEGRDGANVTGSKVDVPVSDGEAFNLTDKLENLNGTTGDDTFRGTDGTTSAGDMIDGKAGNDAFMAFSTGKIPQMVSIENLVVDNLTAGLSTTGRTSLENVTIQNSTFTGARSVTLANGEALTLINHEGAQNIDLSTTKASETITLNDVGSIKGNDVDINLTASAADVTELTLNGTGASSDVDIEDTDDKLETLKITGDQNIDVEIVDIANSLKTYDASAATTGQTFAVDATSTSDLTITGSAGDDSFSLGNTLTKADKIDGGEGNDTLRIAPTASITGDLQISNVEILRVDDATQTVNRTIDLDDVAGLTTLRVAEGANANQTVTFSDVATTATTIQFTGDEKDAPQTFDGISVDYDGSGVAAKVVISNKVEAQNVTINGIDIDNAKKISIDASNLGTGSGEKLDPGIITGSDLESVDVKADGKIDIQIVGTGELEKVDLANSNAGIILDLDTIKADAEVTLGDGSDAIDIVGVGTTALTITTGKGSDKITLADSTGTNAGVEIEDFTAGAGGDRLDFAAGSFQTGAASFAVQTGAAAIDFGTTGLTVINANSSNVGASMTAAQVKSAAISAVTGIGSGEKTLVALSADAGAASDVYIYKMTATTPTGSTAVDIASVTLIATLSGVRADQLTSDNFIDFVG